MRNAGIFALLLSTALGSFSLASTPTTSRDTTSTQVSHGRDPVKPVPWGKPRAS